MIRFNVSGLIMGVLCAVCWSIFSAIGIAEPMAAYVALGTLLLMDIAYRWTNDEEGIWKWLNGKSGGFLGIAPVWITAIILIGLFASGFLD